MSINETISNVWTKISKAEFIRRFPVGSKWRIEKYPGGTCAPSDETAWRYVKSHNATFCNTYCEATGKSPYLHFDAGQTYWARPDGAIGTICNGSDAATPTLIYAPRD